MQHGFPGREWDRSETVAASRHAATPLTSALSAVEPIVDSNRAQVPANEAGSAAASRRPSP
ncbi:hypothetical protein [Xanthomonas hortorum]|uniref:Uncharacterized protein n=1 Tax=Xanthomonas hortorum TaxID=56454 RepID=A0AA47EX43_9XANT|nr:hypothetical protein [Xanthomonas hortorum]WAH65730.1 hypothetical protein OEG85_07230 [Xanthomonas hortorum]